MIVVNLRKSKHTIYIGRGSIFGNPFVIGKDGNRENVIKKYENWALSNIVTNSKFRHAIYHLPKNAILGCYCAPKACHGDIIVKIWKVLHNELE